MAKPKSDPPPAKRATAKQPAAEQLKVRLAFQEAAPREVERWSTWLAEHGLTVTGSSHSGIDLAGGKMELESTLGVEIDLTKSGPPKISSVTNSPKKSGSRVPEAYIPQKPRFYS